MIELFRDLMREEFYLRVALSSTIASICSGVRLLAGAASTRVTFEATKNMSAIASAVILFTKLRFLLLFSYKYCVDLMGTPLAIRAGWIC